MEAKKEPKIESDKPKEEAVKTEKKEENNTQVKQEAKEASSTETALFKDPLLESFYSEIDDIKPEDFKTNSKEQLERLLRPGSTYFNLNPFEVLQIDPYLSVDEIKKKYRKLSIYVHPDKNPDDRERAQVAFEAVNRAYKMLENDTERKKCLEVVDEARVKVEEMCDEKRRKARKELVAKLKSKPRDDKSEDTYNVKIDEDDPDKYRHAVYVMTCKLFADIERLKVRESEKQAQEKKRKAEERSNEQQKAKVQKEWDKNYEESRQNRVNSWQNFMNKKGPGGGGGMGSRLPKFKPEKR